MQTIWYIVNVCRFYPIVLLKFYQHYTLRCAQQNLILCNMYGVRIFASFNILSPPMEVCVADTFAAVSPVQQDGLSLVGHLSLTGILPATHSY